MHSTIQLFLLALFVGLATTALPDASLAQSDLRSHYMIDLPPTLAVGGGFERGIPGTSLSTPTAFGADWRDAFIGVGYQHRARFTSKNDGAVAAGVGFFDARDHMGLEVTFTSFSTVRQGFGENWGVSWKVHRAIPGNASVAVGWENFVHAEGTDGGTSAYFVMSKQFTLRQELDWFNSMTITAGVGGGRFRMEDDVIADNGTIGVFGSLGFRVAQPLSAVINWTGQDLAAGVSVAPFKHIPFAVNLGVGDIIGTAGDGARFFVSAGYGIHF